MPFIQTGDGTQLFYKDWGTGQPVLFVHGWVLGADMWEYQMTPLAAQGLRCIAYDLRGAGRSDQPGHGYDPDTLAADLATVLQQLDLQQVTLVGHSMGSAQIARYLARHHADRDRVARVVFVATTLPFLRKTDDNPDGLDGAVFEETLAAVGDDRPRFAAGVADLWFGNGLPGVAVSPELQQWLIGLFLQASPRAAADMFRAFTHTDFRADLAAIQVPTLIVHGDSDAMSPFEVSARKAAAAIPHSQLTLYHNASHGLFVSHRHRLNADLIQFIKH
jgi:pimeloyl-ACP methyl ester carboxylesterase